MKKISLLFFVVFAFHLQAQDELMSLLENSVNDDDGEVSATFKSTRVINGNSIEVRSKGILEFVISHRFGTINSGYQEFWGLDFSNIRLGLEYGITDDLNVGIGRSSFDKVFDLFGKYRIIRQSNKIPVTMTIFASIARKTVEQAGLTGVDRNAYTAQLLIARKLNDRISLQLAPTFIQRNLVPTVEDDNLLIALGIGSRYKVSNRVAIVMEYYPQLTNYSSQFQNSFAVGVDIETGGHVFQLQLTNAVQMNERGFIGETTDQYLDGGIHFGFNISRVFDLNPKG